MPAAARAAVLPVLKCAGATVWRCAQGRVRSRDRRQPSAESAGGGVRSRCNTCSSCRWRSRSSMVRCFTADNCVRTSKSNRGTNTRTRPTVQRRAQCLEVPKRQPQRAGSADEQQSVHIPRGILPVPCGRAARVWQHADLFVVTNRFRRHARSLRELANGQRLRHRRGPLLLSLAEDRASSRWKVKSERIVSGHSTWRPASVNVLLGRTRAQQTRKPPYVLPTHQPGKAGEALGDQFGVLDDVARVRITPGMSTLPSGSFTCSQVVRIRSVLRFMPLRPLAVPSCPGTSCRAAVFRPAPLSAGADCSLTRAAL